jgi:hypothetical protein
MAGLVPAKRCSLIPDGPFLIFYNLWRQNIEQRMSQAELKKMMLLRFPVRYSIFNKKLLLIIPFDIGFEQTPGEFPDKFAVEMIEKQTDDFVKLAGPFNVFF